MSMWTTFRQAFGSGSAATTAALRAAVVTSRASPAPLAALGGLTAACLNLRASERSVLKLIASSSNASHQTLLDRILVSPNDAQSFPEVVEQLSMLYDLYGIAALYVDNSDSKHPQLWILDSCFCNPLFEDPAGVAPTHFQFNGLKVPIGELILIRHWAPGAPFFAGRGFAAQSESSLHLYEAVNAAQVNFFASGGLPAVAIELPKDCVMSPDEWAYYQTLWRDRFNPKSGSSNIALLPDGAKATTFGPNELTYAQSKQQVDKEIRETLTVPRILLGDTDNVNHNNGQTAMAIFERTVVLRFAQKMAASFQHAFRRLLNDDSIELTVDESMFNSFTQLVQQNGLVNSQPLSSAAA